jgi:uncharacterized membrane protein
VRSLRKEILSWVLIAAAWGFSLALYARLPESIATHWDFHGRPDGFTSKPWGAFVTPMVMIGIYFVFLVAPKISPRGYRFDSFLGVWEIVRTAMLALLLLVHVLILLSGAGVAIDLVRATETGGGLFLVLLGNYMGKLGKNFFFGIRTPWTLASDEVWLRTHRLGGKLFVIAGLVLFGTGVFGAGPVLPMIAIGAAALVSVAYSYLLYRRLEGFKEETREENPSG